MFPKSYAVGPWAYCLWWHRWSLCMNLRVSSIQTYSHWHCWMSNMPAETNTNPLYSTILQGDKWDKWGIKWVVVYIRYLLSCRNSDLSFLELLQTPDSWLQCLLQQEQPQTYNPYYLTPHCCRPREPFNMKRQQWAQSDKLLWSNRVCLKT